MKSHNIYSYILGVITLYGTPALSQVISGSVYDSLLRKPLAGTTLHIRGTQKVIVSAEDGTFSYNHDGSFPLWLDISYMGYDLKALQVNQSNEFIHVLLTPNDRSLLEVVVSSRRRRETAQNIPIPITVLGAAQIDNSLSFNVNRVKELAPSVQLYSSNPRNTTLNIRGLGSTFGLTNDGIDPGVGFYVDGVYYARPAATTIDFIDVEQIEVLRGPQGTLFGKNTTAGAFNVTTRRPEHAFKAQAELSYGNLGFVQAKSSVTGALLRDKLAGRLSFTGTHRDGTIYNVAKQKHTNTLNNLGLRGQLLYQPSDRVELLLSADYSSQRPDGYAQIVAGVVPTLRPAYRQFEQIIADLNYRLPTFNPFDRVIDHDVAWRSGQDLGGISLNADVRLGKGTLTSTTAYRYWNWDPSNDRDFTGLQGLALSQAPSKHWQLSQEVRYAGEWNDRLSGAVGIFAFYQQLDPDGAHQEEAGRDQWRFSQSSTSTLWKTPGLLDGYGIKNYPSFRNFSGATFGQLDWKILPQLSLIPGVRINYDEKKVDFRRETYGGLQTNDPALLAIKQSVYSDQAFQTSIDNFNFSGQLSAAYRLRKTVNLFATYALGFKPVGLNLGGLPNINGQPALDLAVISPEQVRHLEFVIKTTPAKNAILNVTVFQTGISNFQTQVQTPDLAVNRGYLSNAEKVRVVGAELDASYRQSNWLTLYGAISYTDGKYVSFANAPVPLEETGGKSFKDISGGRLPGISRWSASVSGEITRKAKLQDKKGELFLGLDMFYRSEFSSSPSPSAFLNIPGYALLNPRLGIRTNDGLAFFIWSRNLLDQNYFEQLLPGAGNAGHYGAVLGDPRTYGITLRIAVQ